VIKIGLTGGIGSGKSVVAKMLRERGATVIDADQLAREAVAPGTDGLARVVAEFGADVLAADGSLDRARLGRVVFSDASRREALEAIVHPYVARRSAEIMERTGLADVVVYDVPLLVEKRMQEGFDLVVVVEAAEETQVARVVAGRGMGAEEARSRISAQASREQRRAAADVVLHNDGTLDDLARQVDDLWTRVTTSP
jgi:dephospho-CoA kinase